MGVSPEPRPAPGSLDVVREFLNTADLEDETDSFATARGVRLWLLEHGMLARTVRVDEADRRRFVNVREGLRALAFANNGGWLSQDAIKQLNRHAAAAAIAPVFAGGEEVSLVTYRRDAEGALSALLAIVCQAMRDGTWSRLKACRSEHCRWAFYDASRNRSGNWCSMAMCGNRSKTRAYRQRRRDPIDPKRGPRGSHRSTR